jgi:hypothetical protein
VTWGKYTNDGFVIYDDLGVEVAGLPLSATSDEVAEAFRAINRTEQEPDWARFKRIAMASSTFTAITTAIPPQSCAYLTTALVMAEMGQLDLFKWAWSEIVRQAGIPPDVTAGFAGIASACNLPAEFVAALNPRLALAD